MQSRCTKLAAMVAALAGASTSMAQVSPPNIPVGAVIISEIFYNPAGDESQSEFVELFNVTNLPGSGFSATTFDLAGASISDIQDQGLQLGDAFDSYILAPGEVVILVDPTEFEDDDNVRIGSPTAPVQRVDILVPSPTNGFDVAGFTEADYALWLGNQVLGRILFVEDLPAQANSGSASNETTEIANIPRGDSQFGPGILGDQFSIDIANYENATGGWPDPTVFPGLPPIFQNFGGQSIQVRGGALNFIENDIGFNWVGASFAPNTASSGDPLDDPATGVVQGVEVIIPYRLSPAVDRVTGTPFNDQNDNFIQDSSDENTLFVFDPNGEPVFDGDGNPIFFYRVFDGTRFLQETQTQVFDETLGDFRDLTPEEEMDEELTTFEVPVFDANGFPVYVLDNEGERIDTGEGPFELSSPGVVDTRLLFDNDCNDNSIIDAIELTDGDATDLNFNGVLDECEIDDAGGTNGVGGPADQNENGLLDSTEIAVNRELDCDLNGTFDFIQINAAGGTDGAGGTLDTNADGRLDACEANTILISELMYDPRNDGGAEPEYIELKNLTASTIDVSGWRIAELEDTEVVDDVVVPETLYTPFPAGTTIPANGHLVVIAATDTPGQATTQFQSLWGSSATYIELPDFDGLTNGNVSPSQEIMAILNASGFIVDVANYVGNDSSGNPALGWPGNNNESSIQVTPEALASADPAAANNDGTNWELALEGINAARQSNLAADTRFSGQQFGNIGSPGDSNTTGVSEQPLGDVIFTEIAYATNGVAQNSFEIEPATMLGETPTVTDRITRTPTNEGFFNAPDDFVEIYNTSGTTLDLSGWFLRDEDGRTGSFPAGTSLAPGELAVVVGLPESPEVGAGRDWIGNNVAPRTNLYSAYPGDYQIILVSDFYTQDNGVFGLEGLADQSDATIRFNFPINLSPSGVREVLQIVDSSGNIQDIVNFDDITPWPFQQPGLPNTNTSSIVYTGPLNAVANDNGSLWSQASQQGGLFGTGDGNTTRANDYTLDSTPLGADPVTLLPPSGNSPILNPVYNGFLYYSSPGLLEGVRQISDLGASPAISTGACCVALIDPRQCFDGAEQEACELQGGFYFDAQTCSESICPSGCPGDVNDDGVADAFDIAEALAGELEFNFDGNFTIEDVQGIITAVQTGCDASPI